MSDSESDLDGIVDRQNILFNSLKKVITNYKKDSLARKTKPYYECRIEKVNNICVEFRNNDKHLILNKLDHKSEYFENDTADLFEETFLDCICLLKGDFEKQFPTTSKLPAASSNNTEAPAAKNPSTRLSKIQVPIFEGKYTDWPHFRDMYSSLVHTNAQLSKVEKFWYLKNSLKGDPYDIVKHMITTEENYIAAWKLITDQYENPRELFKSQMNLFSSQTKINEENAHKIRSLLSVSRECRQALSNFRIDVENCDPILIFFITQKLPAETVGQWEMKMGGSTELPNFNDFQTFLDTRIKTLEAMAENKATSTSSKSSPISANSTTSNNFSTKKKRSFHITTSENKSKQLSPCCLCNEGHIIRKCPKFLSMSTIDRRKAIEGKRICFNCLANDHAINNCYSKHNCRCGARHHTLIHVDSQKPGTTESITSTPDPVHTHIARLVQRRVLLSTAIVKVKNSQGNFIELRALIDKGSEASLITARASRWLNLPECPVNATVTGISDVKADSCKKVVQLNVQSKYNNYEIDVTAFIMQRLTSLLPHKSIVNTNWPHIAQLQLADPEFYKSAKIDLLLGCEVYAEIIRDGLKKADGLPTAQCTEFGWILMGSINTNTQSNLEIKTMVTKIEIDQLIQRFWEVDNISQTRELNSDEKWCENFFKQTTKRTLSGRYLIRLPFKTNTDKEAVLGKSKQIAINQFVQLERKFLKDPGYHSAYANVFNEYLNLKQMELIKMSEEDCTNFNDGKIVVKGCYLPHHAVIKASSSTTQLRIVFDASRKTSNGRSLNDILFPGPILHNDLPSIITNWRFHSVAFTADLQQMFRQILVHDEDAQFQRVIWRNHPSESIKEYYLKTVTFGTTSAPFLAIRTIQQLAHDYQDAYPEAYPFIMDSIYVDDIFGGADTVQKALNIQNQLINIFHEGKFHLRKWVSNEEMLLESVPLEDREIKLPLALNMDDSVKTLGIFWQPSTDEFRFKFNFDLQLTLKEKLTKRIVLSTIARLFDPLGFITPVILPAKLLLRDLWIENLDWDDSVSPKFANHWIEFVRNIQQLKHLKIPRWISTSSESSSLELHGFCDASQNAYAAVIYLRSTDTNGNVHCHLLTSKSRIAPVKSTTIPRLELMGALLLAELFEKIISNWKLQKKPSVFAWTDSEIVIYWLNGDTNRWEVFVCNRIIKIKEIIPAENWRHISTDSNPADFATRGLTVEELTQQNIWWSGPTFLRTSVDIHSQPAIKTKEKIDCNVHRVVDPVQKPNDAIIILQRFSSFNKLLRTTALIQLLACKARHETVNSHLSVQQLTNARNCWTRIVQQQELSMEYGALAKNISISNKSKLLSLNPFLDTNMLMRVRGRLENSNLTYDEKFPIILPPKSHFTKLIIQEYHKLTLHGGTQLILTWLRKRYWIINARNTVRFELLKCVVCYRIRAKAGEQRMGVLPSPRVQPSFVFSSTGVDFAGPIEVKASKYRCHVKYKGYIAIFVCLTTRAIHIELVGDMSTGIFLAALKRFLSRRNMCSAIYSDCGTTFVGATNQLKNQEKLWKQQIDDEILPYLVNRAITWHFIPPATPHFGGIWEAGVKSIKYHLKRICGDRSYTYEEWSTVLIEIEGILNSRPLCAYTSDKDDLTAITPNHFLNGDISRALPETDVDVSNKDLPTHLRELMQLKKMFWRQWSSEYLNQLQSRPKWLQTTPNLEINNLVLIKDERLPPLNWLMGRIVEIHPGRDGLVRVASVRTKNGILKRPITKLCILPIDQVDQST